MDILRLPFFALKEVLQNLNPIELFLLSQCSTHMSSLIPIAGTEKFNLSIDLERRTVFINHYSFKAFRHGDDIPSEYHMDYKQYQHDLGAPTYPVKIKNSMIPVSYFLNTGYYYPERLKFLWNDYAIGMLELALHLSKVFECPIKELRTSQQLPSNKNLEIIGGIIDRQLRPLENLTLSDGLEHEDFKWILDYVPVLGRLSIKCYSRRGLKPSYDNIPECDSIYVKPAFWITPNHLMSFNSYKTIILLDSRLSLNTLNSFIDHWKAGFLPKLRFFVFSSNYTYVNCGLIQGFTRDQLKAERTVERWEKVDGYVRSCSRGVDIEGFEGTTASIEIDILEFKLYAWGH